MGDTRFEVETRGQGAIVLGGDAMLVNLLIQELLLLGISAISPENEDQILALKNTHDLDYIICFGDGRLGDFKDVLMHSLESGESRLVYLRHYLSKPVSLGLAPVSKEIVYSDYLSQDHYCSPTLDSWLSSIKEGRVIVIPGDGLSEVSLLGLHDLSHLLAESAITPSRRLGEVTGISNPTTLSLLNLAYLIRTSLPFKINLTFDSSLSAPSDFFSSLDASGASSSQIKENAEELLAKYLETHGLDDVSLSPPPAPQEVVVEPVKPTIKLKEIPKIAKTPREPTPSQDSQPIKRLTPLRVQAPVFVPLQIKKSRPKISFSGLTKFRGSPKFTVASIVVKGILVALALYLGTLAFTGTILYLSGKSIAKSFVAKQLPVVSSLDKASLTYIQANWLAISMLTGTSKTPKVAELSRLLDAYSQTLVLIGSARTFSTTAEDLMHYVFGSGGSDVVQLVSSSRLQSEELYQQLSLLEGMLPSTPPSIIPAKYQSIYKQGRADLTDVKRGVLTTKAILSTLPDIIGLAGRKKYGVLFQNNMELRPTGGFIGSFAILSFENGKLYDMPIYDVYDADGQLKGHVEPPKPIKDVLGEANWYLRDSNFDPDFPTSARRAEWFIKKTLNQDLDGTIAVNVNTLIDLLRATGPLTLTDYQETITDSNLYERSQYHAEVNFFPGSTQKKEFLSTVANALFAKLPSLGSGEGIKLIAALSNSVTSKDTLISLSSESSGKVLETLGWNGQLTDYPCPLGNNCHKDYAMIVDSNFGVNKANYFMKRNIEEVITFDKNLSVGHLLKVSYQNTATSTAWPAGVYKNYQRIYLPIGTSINSVMVGDKVLSPKDYTITSEHNRFVIGYLALVPVSSTLLVQIDYTLPQLPQDKDLLYTWYWQKQSGTSSEDKLTVYLNYPMYLKPGVISPQAELNPQQLKFNFLNDTDHRLTVKFSK